MPLAGEMSTALASVTRLRARGNFFRNLPGSAGLDPLNPDGSRLLPSVKGKSMTHRVRLIPLVLASACLIGAGSAAANDENVSDETHVDHPSDAPGHDWEDRGDRINDRLDDRGERINDRLDRRADRAWANGHYARAHRLDRRGDRIEDRLDRRGDRIDRRLDRRSDRVRDRHARRHHRRAHRLHHRFHHRTHHRH